VTGTLGGSAAGLRLIERGAHLADQNFGASETQIIDYVLLRHLKPEPRVGWGMVLGQEKRATSLIDISDGLSSDLNHLCSESKVGSLIHSSLIPIDEQVIELCGRGVGSVTTGSSRRRRFWCYLQSDQTSFPLPRRVDGAATHW
jgi:thiamine-monophosphate kinase